MEAKNQIIVVEDDAADYELITEALLQSGCRFAARRVDTQEELDEELFRLSPDLVLCDHGSAKWDSLSILQQVREFESTMPFVVVSGAVDGRTQAQLRRRGVDDCVPKHRLGDLGSTVQRVLRAHEELRRQRVDEIRRTALPLELR
jgi:DNA-binding response OmpR family regulator